MYIPLLVFLGAVLVSIYFAIVWDNDARRLSGHRVPRSRVTLCAILERFICLCFSSTQVLPVSNESAADIEDEEDEDIIRFRKRKIRSEFHAKLKDNSGCNGHSIFEDSLPKVFQTANFIPKICTEIMRHHKWISLIYYHSNEFSRVLRVLSVTTNIVSVIFFIALTFSVLNPERNNNCSSFTTESACTSPLSKFHTGKSECIWEGRESICRFQEANVLIRVILFVVVFSVLLAAPVKLITDYAFKYILAAPIIDPSNKYLLKDNSNNNTSEEDVNIKNNNNNNVTEYEDNKMEDGDGGNVRKKPSLLVPTAMDHIAAVDLFKSKSRNKRVDSTNSAAAPPSADSSGDFGLAELEAEMRRYRETNVKGIIERRRFDRIWGLAPSGHFIKPEEVKPTDSYLHSISVKLLRPDRAHIRSQIILGLRRAQNIEDREVKRISHTSLTDSEAGRLLLFYLHCDMLPGLSGRILENKGQREMDDIPPVHWGAKIVAWVAVIALYVWCFYFVVFFFAQTQNRPRQTAWFKSFMLYLVVDFVGISGAHVLVTHYIVPSTALRKVTAVKEYLARKMLRLETEIQKHLTAVAMKGDLELGAIVTKSSSQLNSFNAARYLYASYRLSAYFLDLRESQIVRLCGETQNTRQQSLKEVLFGTPRPALIKPWSSSSRSNHSEKRSYGNGGTGSPSTAGEQEREGWVPVGILFLLEICNFLISQMVAWFLVFIPQLLLRFFYAIVRPFLVVAVGFPECVQDLILEVVAVGVIGCVLLLHVMLYEYYPPIAFLPIFVIGVCTHFYFTSLNGSEQIKLARLKKATLNEKAEQHKLVEKRLAIEERKMAAEKGNEGIESAQAASAHPDGNNDVVNINKAEEDGVTSVHTTIHRSSALRSSFQREDFKAAAALLDMMDLDQSAYRSASGRNSARAGSISGADGGDRSSPHHEESRLHHFLSSADKVLIQHDPHHHSHSVSTTPTHQLASDPHRSFHSNTNTLRAVDSFNQSKATAEPSPTDLSSAVAAIHPKHKSEGLEENPQNNKRLVKNSTLGAEAMAAVSSSHQQTVLH